MRLNMSFFEQYALQHSELPIHLTQADCLGKTYIVTGSNSGIGFECAKHLVKFGAHRVILAVRSIERGLAAQTQIEADTGRKDVVDVWEFDLSSYKSVQKFAKRVETELERVDAIVQNATAADGAWSVAEGLESTLTINVVSTFLLIILLMPYLKKCAGLFSMKAQIVLVTSSMGFGRQADLKKIGDGNILQELSDNKKWTMSGTDRYALSKLLGMFAARQLAALAPESETGVVINIVCPGLAKTTLTKNSSLMIRVIFRGLQMIMGQTPEWSSRNLLFGISAGEESHGKFSTYCEIRENWVPEFITNASGKRFGERLWEDLVVELERIQPGCVPKALGTE
ncbi:Short-chain dehydrogenase/reductase phmF [Paramyrothecium foliicola]|nr:Short-chain dehydrogenase/reductase phmF [Paramyrothecium foliicola]